MPTERAGGGSKRTARRSSSTRPVRLVADRPAAGPARPLGMGLLRALPPTLRRDLAGLLLVMLALLLALALVLPTSGLSRFARDSLLALFGRGAPVVPAWILLLTIGQIRGLERFRPRGRHLVGVTLLTLGGLGLLHLPLADPAREAARGEGGGQIGWWLAGVATAVIGGPGAWVVLGGLVVAGLLVLLADLQESGQGGVTWAGLGRPAAGLRAAVTALPRVGASLRASLRWSRRAPRRSLAEEYAASLQARAAASRPAGPPPARPRRAAASPPDETPPEVSPAATPPEPQLILPVTTPRREPTAPPPAATPLAQRGLALWVLPNPRTLDTFPEARPDPADAQQKARIIDQTLASFKVEARVREIYAGPSFTQFAVEPGEGVKVRRITELHNDLALALAVPSLRIEAPVPGKARVGIEIPNARTATVGLRETLETEEWQSARARLKLPLVLGRDVSGRPVVVDMARMPHLLIAGATGAGKSVCLNAIITCLLLQFTPDDLRLVMIDPKRVELSSYNGIPHLQAPVVTDMDKVVGLLRKLVGEMERRYDLLQRLGVRNLDGYLARCQTEPRLERLPYLLLIVDELADLMMTAPEEVEGLLCRLAQMGRATGIHLILATQRPSVDVVTGLIKANFPSRIAFAVSSQIDSRVILDTPGAERLMGRGDMLYQAGDAPKAQRIQGVYLSDPNIEAVVEHWRRQAAGPTFDPEWEHVPSSGADGDGEPEDELLDQAIAVVRQHGTASASMLQRRLRIGYNRAARLLEVLEQKGIIGPAGGRTRAVLEPGASGPLPARGSSDKSDDELPL